MVGSRSGSVFAKTPLVFVGHYQHQAPGGAQQAEHFGEVIRRVKAMLEGVVTEDDTQGVVRKRMDILDEFNAMFSQSQSQALFEVKTEFAPAVQEREIPSPAGAIFKDLIIGLNEPGKVSG